MTFERLMWMIAIAVCGMPTSAIPLAGQDMQAHKHHHYRLIDLGTLGGAQSSVNGGQALNDHGTVVGCADTSTPDPNYPNFNPFLSLFGADPFIFQTFEFKDGRVTDMGAIPGTNSSCESFLTDNGLIVGGSENGLIDPFNGWPAMEAVAWQNGQVTNLGTFGGNESFAIGANNRGQVVGAAANTVPDPYSVFFGWGTQTRAFLWTQSQGLQDLGTLGGPDALAISINDHGQIFGASYTSDVANPLTGIPPFDAFLYENGKMTDIPNGFGGTQVDPFGANNRGQVIGAASFDDEATFHPFLWSKGKFIDLGTFGGTIGEADWINDAGGVTGQAWTSGNAALRGFFWKNGILTDLGTVESDGCSGGLSINSRNQIVGFSATCDGSVFHAFLWEDGKIVDLNSLIARGTDLDLLQATNINDTGEIAGFGALPNGDGHAFLLVPCDEKHPGVAGCDYSMVEESPAISAQQTARAASGGTLLQNIHHPLLRPRGMGRLFPRPTVHGPTANLRDEGPMVSTPLADDLGPVEKPGVAREVPSEARRSAQRETDGEISSCSKEERGASTSAVPPLGYVVHGACSVNQNASTLTGYCQGPILFSHTCSSGKDASQCPSGQKAKEPEWITCGNFAVIRVDDKQPCEFVFK